MDFSHAAEQDDPAEFVNKLAPRMGRKLVEAAAAKHYRPLVEKSSWKQRVGTALQKILDAPHRKPPSWPTIRSGTVRIGTATSQRNGFRQVPLGSDGAAVTKGAALRFVARTDVPRPYKVYWQVVNTGPAAKAARQLRGGFEEVSVTAGTLTKEETASYTGVHSIECFIVKDGHCLARSGPFIVNIA